MKIDIMQLEFIEYRLRKIAKSIEDFFGVEPTITSLYRMNDSGVHGQLPLRGIDLHVPDEYTGKAWETYVNDRWDYDSERPTINCALLHGDPLHLHLQVHPNTQVIL